MTVETIPAGSLLPFSVIMAVKPGTAEDISHKQPNALVVDLLTRYMWRGGIGVRFTPGEFEIAFLIIRRLGGVISREELCQELWGDREDGGPDGQWKLIDVRMCKMRKKQFTALGINAQTVWGRGYQLEDGAPVYNRGFVTQRWAA